MCQALKGHPRQSWLPVLLLSGHLTVSHGTLRGFIYMYVLSDLILVTIPRHIEKVFSMLFYREKRVRRGENNLFKVTLLLDAWASFKSWDGPWLSFHVHVSLGNREARSEHAKILIHSKNVYWAPMLWLSLVGTVYTLECFFSSAQNSLGNCPSPIL